MQHGPAASSGSNPKAPGSAGGYLLFATRVSNFIQTTADNGDSLRSLGGRE